MDTFFKPCNFCSILAEFGISKTCQIVGLPDDSFMYFLDRNYGQISMDTYLYNSKIYVCIRFLLLFSRQFRLLCFNSLYKENIEKLYASKSGIR